MPSDTLPEPNLARFAVDLARPLPGAGGGQSAFAATNAGTGEPGFVAVRVAREAPPRVPELDILGKSVSQVLMPVGHGRGPTEDGGPGYYIFCTAPPGPSLAAAWRSWPEAALLSQVLRPAAQGLMALEALGVTHRAIRANNVFQAGPTMPVVLGGAWAEPPAMRQPVLYEPPYSAACHPAGRGGGSIADDVYALGVLLIVLALGREPLAELDPATVLHRKLSLGSYGALTGTEKLPPAIADLTRNMLAEDPEHRPPPALLLDPVAARGRRVAARPPQRAPRPLMVGQTPVWDARTLAYAIGRQPEAGVKAIRSGAAMQWLRRSLGDANLAVRLEELQRQRQAEGGPNDGRLDAMLLMRAVTLVDALAPLHWRGYVLLPDAIGTMLAASTTGEPGMQATMVEIVATDVLIHWALLRADRIDPLRMRIELQRHRSILQIRGPAGGAPRLLYALNPGLPCASPLLAGHWVSTLPELPSALEAIVGRLEPGAEPFDAHILAFIGARGERRMDAQVNAIGRTGDSCERLIAILRLLAALQQRFTPRGLPALAAWIAAQGAPLVTLWHNRPKREAVAAALNSLAAAGFLAPMLALVEDAAEREQDEQGTAAAEQQRALIDLELTAIAEGAGARALYAERLGHEAAAGAGLALLTTLILLATLG